MLRWTVKKLWPTRGDTRVLLLGLDGGGKTAVFRALQRTVFSGKKNPASEEDDGGESAAYRPTTGQSVARGAAHGRSWCVTDVGGSERSRRAWANYLPDANYVAWVASATDRVEESARCFRALVEDPAMESCPVCVVPTRTADAAQRQALAAAFGDGVAVLECDGSPASAADALAKWLAATAKTSPLVQRRTETIARLQAEQQQQQQQL